MVKTEVAEKFVIVSFLEDLVALEYNETFFLKLKLRSSPLVGLNVLFCDTVEITVTDSDSEYDMP